MNSAGNNDNIEVPGRIAAIILAAGRGTRMKSDVQKQYMVVKEYPILYYSMLVMEQHPAVSDIILVVGPGEEDFCRTQIVEKYGFTKVRSIVPGGKERYESVSNGLAALAEDTQYVLIHDGARPCLTKEILDRSIRGVIDNNACVAAMPVKDTIKVSDAEGFAAQTPERSTLWLIQTPQSFRADVISEGYRRLKESGFTKATDDAMVIERYMPEIKVKLVEGAYENIKVTTPEDLILAEAFLK